MMIGPFFCLAVCCGESSQTVKATPTPTFTIFEPSRLAIMMTRGGIAMMTLCVLLLLPLPLAADACCRRRAATAYCCRFRCIAAVVYLFLLLHLNHPVFFTSLPSRRTLQGPFPQFPQPHTHNSFHPRLPYRRCNSVHEHNTRYKPRQRA